MVPSHLIILCYWLQNIKKKKLEKRIIVRLSQYSIAIRIIYQSV